MKFIPERISQITSVQSKDHNRHVHELTQLSEILRNVSSGPDIRMSRLRIDYNRLFHIKRPLNIFNNRDIGHKSSLTNASQSAIQPLSVIHESFHVRYIDSSVGKERKRCTRIIRRSLMRCNHQIRRLQTLDPRLIHLKPQPLRIKPGCSPDKRHQEEILF